MQLDELIVSIRADTHQLEQSLRGVQQNVRTMSTSLSGSTKGLDQLNRTSDTAARSINTNLKGALEGIQTPLGNVGSLVRQLAGPAGLVAFAGAGVAAARGLSRWADALRDLASATGLSVETLQRFRQAEQEAGVEADTLADLTSRVLERFNRSASTAAEVEGAFNRLGIELRESSGELRSMDEVMPDFFQRLGELESATDRAAVGQDALGRGFRNVDDAITDLADAFDNINERRVFTDAQLAEAAKMDEELRRVGKEIRVFFTGLAIDIEGLMGNAKQAFQRELLIPVFEGLADLNRFIAKQIGRFPGLGDVFAAPARQAEQSARDYVDAPGALPGLPDGIEIEIDTSQADAAIARLRDELAEPIEIDVGAELAADTLIRQINQALGILGTGITTVTGLGQTPGALREQEAAQRELADKIRGGGDVVLDSLNILSSDWLSAGQKVTGVLSNLVGSISNFLFPIGSAAGGIISGFINFVGGLFGPGETGKRNDQIRASINATLREMELLGQVDIGPVAQAAMDNLAVSLKDRGLSAANAIRAVTENFEFIEGLIEDGVRGQALVNAVLDKVRLDLEKTEEGLSEIATTMNNIPTGIKVGLLRFNATIADAGRLLPGLPIVDGFGPPGGFPTLPATEMVMRDGIHIEGGLTIVNEAGDTPEDLVRKLETGVRQRAVRGGMTIFEGTRVTTKGGR